MTARYLESLRTQQGDKTAYDAVSECSRCGYCEQSCPTYVASGKETFNPRGRNQLFRMILEGKLKNPAPAEEAFSTCLLCGACSSVCYAGVKTADFVLDGRRRIRKGKAPWPARALASLLAPARPTALAWLLRLANLARWTGLARLAALLRLPTLFGLKGLEEAEKTVRPKPLSFLFEKLENEPRPAGDEWRYFSACGPNFLYPRVGQATMRACGELLGKGGWSGGGCCGLLSYNYGELGTAKDFAKRTIERFEAGPAAPLVVDCSSCAAHMKGYEQLFVDDPDWRGRALAFSAWVRDALEVLPEAAGLARASVPAGRRVTYHDSCRARNGEGLAKPPRELLKAMLGKSYIELPEAEACCGGAGAFSMLHPELSDSILRRKVSAVASIQADLVLTSSTSCLIQLEYGLARYYPEARVQHISEFIAERLGSEEAAAA